MCKGLLGKKVGMTGVFSYDGSYVPVTVLEIGPCVITQIKKDVIDGYKALQIAFGSKRSKRTTKPMKGHFSKSGSGNFYFVREVGVEDPDSYDIGQVLKADVFKVGEKVNVTGITKGRGFSGVMKRHGFSGGRKTHGCKSHRVPGSIGCSAWPGRVIKGKKMPGRYGGNCKTVRNLEIIDIRFDQNIILLKGAVPGSKSSNIIINKVKFV